MKSRQNATYAYRLIGSIFAILGGAFIIVAVTIHLTSYGRINTSLIFLGETPFIVSLVFFQLGVPFFIVGAAFSIWASARRRRTRRLIAEGDKITADIDDIVVNYHIRVNRSYPYKLLCSWQDTRSGITYHFRSDNLWTNPARLLEQRGIKTVTVYVDRNDMRKYHVEVPGYDERNVYL